MEGYEEEVDVFLPGGPVKWICGVHGGERREISCSMSCYQVFPMLRTQVPREPILELTAVWEGVVLLHDSISMGYIVRRGRAPSPVEAVALQMLLSSLRFNFHGGNEGLNAAGSPEMF
jgi:hypothetical protein